MGHINTLYVGLIIEFFLCSQEHEINASKCLLKACLILDGVSRPLELLGNITETLFIVFQVIPDFKMTHL